MEIYQLKQKNLPAEVLFLKEIARKCISPKQYKYLRKHALIIRNIRGWVGGTWYQFDYNRNAGLPSIHISASSKSELWKDTNVQIFLHEVTHMIEHNRRKRKNRRAHTKVFWNKLEKIKSNYKKISVDEMYKIIDKCKKTEQKHTEKKEHNKTRKKEEQAKKRTIEYKLEQTRKRIKSWETKKKRTETYLKKLRKREKIYVNRI